MRVAILAVAGFAGMFLGILSLPRGEDGSIPRGTGSLALCMASAGVAAALASVVLAFRAEPASRGRVPPGKVRTAVCFLALFTVMGAVLQWLYVLRLP